MRHTHISTTGLQTHSSFDEGKLQVLHQEKLDGGERGGEEVDGSGSGRVKIAHFDMQDGVGEINGSGSGSGVRRGIRDILDVIRRAVGKERAEGEV